MNTIKTLVIRFSNTITKQEIPLFRGAVINSGLQDNILFHNHQGDNFRYSYPLIQYKRLHGKAAIVCLGEGAETIGQLLLQDKIVIKQDNEEKTFEVQSVTSGRTLIQTWKENIDYHICNWLALNTKNYLIYQNIDDENEKCAFLENLLKANLLSMLKGLNIHLNDQLSLKITHLYGTHIDYFKGIGFTSFNADFTCNLSIPNNIGIGKSSSMGFGIVYRKTAKHKSLTGKQ